MIKRAIWQWSTIARDGTSYIIKYAHSASMKRTEAPSVLWIIHEHKWSYRYNKTKLPKLVLNVLISAR